jgi:hypothetical protein
VAPFAIDALDDVAGAVGEVRDAGVRRAEPAAVPAVTLIGTAWEDGESGDHAERQERLHADTGDIERVSPRGGLPRRDRVRTAR